jgi:IPT/TIG domain/PASTA domain
MRRLTLLASCLMVLGAVTAPAAGAADFTLGADLDQAGYVPVPFSEAGTVVNTSVSGLGAHAVSPVDGLIVAWNIAQNSVGVQYRLRVMTPLGPGLYLPTGSSSVGIPPGAYEASFATALPIAAGQTIGLDVGRNAPIGYVSPLLGASALVWNPVPAEGLPTPTATAQAELQYAFNAEVQPAPSIASIGPAHGAPAGGTTVTITGADLEGATAVKFGTTPAAAYTVVSEGQITATAPAHDAGPAPISVTTIAGTGTSSQAFTYDGPPAVAPGPAPSPGPSPSPPATCTVPNLKGKKLGAAKRSSKAAACRVGTVTKGRGITPKSGKVKSQSPKPGKVLAAGAKVNVTLG